MSTLGRRGVRTAQIARVPAVAAAEVPRRAFEHDDARARLARGQRRAQRGVAAAEHRDVVARAARRSRRPLRAAPRRRARGAACARAAARRAPAPPRGSAAAADRPREEHRQVAFADREGAAELLLRQRPEHQPEHGRDEREVVERASRSRRRRRRRGARGRAASGSGCTRRATRARGCRRRAAAAARSITRAQTPASGRFSTSSIDVADVEAGDQRPHEVRPRREQQRPRLQPVLLERREQDRGGRRRRQPERQQRHEHARGRGVVRRLGAGDALDGAVAELLGRDRSAASRRRTRGTSGSPSRRTAARRAETRSPCRAATASTTLPVLAAHPGEVAAAAPAASSSRPCRHAW